MHIELLKELTRQIAGKNTETIVDVLKGEKAVNEFKIADKLKLTINQTRNILYKLYNQGIVSFTRKKDARKGWYIYSWQLNIPKALDRLLVMKKRQLEELRHQLSAREHKRFYVCESCGIEMTEESALGHDFLCPECGKLLQPDIHEKQLQELKQRIEKLKAELRVIQQELASLAVKEVKAKPKAKIKKARRKVARKAKKKKAKQKARKPRARIKRPKAKRKAKKKIKYKTKARKRKKR